MSAVRVREGRKIFWDMTFNYALLMTMEKEFASPLLNKAAEICKRQLTVDQPLWSTNLLDSLGRVELAFYVSDLTGVEIQPEDVTAANFESVGHILKFLSRKGLTIK